MPSQVEEPGVLQVVQELSTCDQQIVLDNLCAVVWSLPGRGHGYVEIDLAPGYSLDIQLIDGVQLLLIERSSSEEDQWMVFGIVVECEIRAGGRHIALLLNLVDAHGGYIKDPQIVVIFRVYIERFLLS